MNDSILARSGRARVAAALCVAFGAAACGDVSLPNDGQDAAAPAPDAAPAPTPDAAPAPTPDAAIDAAPEQPDPTLVVRYSFDALDGAAFRDETGNGREATCVDQCPTLSAGVFGNAASFDGARFLRVTDDGALGTTAGFTLSVWVSLRSLPVDTRAAAAGKPVGDGFANSWQLVFEPDGRTTFFTGVNDENLDFHTAGEPLALDTFTHVALTWDGTTKRIYIDGERRGDERAAEVAFSNNPLLIGGDLDGNSPVAFLDGLLDELRVYRRALSDAEIAALATR